MGCPDKLQDVLSQATTLLKPTGKLLILDVYHNICKPLLHYEFGLLHALEKNKTLSLDTLKKQISLRMQVDPDLFLHPSYFQNLLSIKPILKSIQCFFKAGEKNDNDAPNPMVRYRYGVILDTQPHKNFPYPVTIIEWGKDITSLSSLLAWLRKNEPHAIILKNIPNSRTFNAARLVQFINQEETVKTAADIIKLINSFLPIDTIDPHQLNGALTPLNYRVDNMLFANDDVAYFNASITKATSSLANNMLSTR